MSVIVSRMDCAQSGMNAEEIHLDNLLQEAWWTKEDYDYPGFWHRVVE